jgi:hypothetical protein
LAGLVCVGLLAWAGVAGAAVVNQDDWYGQLNIRAGSCYNPGTGVWAECAMMPLLGWRCFTLEGGVAVDGQAFATVTYDVGSLTDLGINAPWAKYVSLHIGPYIAIDYNATDNGVDWNHAPNIGVAFTFLELGFDQGNTERQKQVNKPVGF